MDTKSLIVDVRDDIRSGREPFSKIMKVVSALRPHEQLQLIAPFEPVPLYLVLERQGFTHKAQPTESGDWEVLFTRGPQTNAAIPGHHVRSEPSCGDGRAPGAATKLVEVDARGLEPPQPMVKILEALARLAAGEELSAHTDRRPMHLYPHLEERGFAATTEEQPDGSFSTYIRRS